MILNDDSGWNVMAGTTLIARVGRAAAVFGVSAAMVALAACSSGTTTTPAEDTSTPIGPAPTSTASSSVASPADQAMQDALAAYQGMWQDFVVAGRTSDWQAPALGQHATGVALTNLSRGLYADHNNGVVTKGEPALNPSVSSVEPPGAPTQVVITDCGDSTNWLKYRKDNGQLADDEPGGRRLINAIVQKQSDGAWKVSEYGVHEVGSC